MVEYRVSNGILGSKPKYVYLLSIRTLYHRDDSHLLIYLSIFLILPHYLLLLAFELHSVGRRKLNNDMDYKLKKKILTAEGEITLEFFFCHTWYDIEWPLSWLIKSIKSCNIITLEVGLFVPLSI